MLQPAAIAELWRGDLLESTHSGHAVIFGPDGIVEAWGDPDRVIFPRSSCKMIQALPLVESGAADAAGLSEAHLALACASHHGAAKHVKLAGDWLAAIGLGESDLRCGPQEPDDREERNRLIKSDASPCQLHNNCSGKHCGFLTVTRHMKAGPEYHEIDHPLQRAIRQTTEEVAEETVAGYGVDGCSAPNFALTLSGLARAMARFAAATGTGDARDRAMFRLVRAMASHPDLIAGEGGACTELMRAMQGRVAVKTGAEAVYVAIVPEKRLGIALKISDGAKRASDLAITSLLVRAGVLDRDHPAASRRLTMPMPSRRGLRAAELRPAPGFPG